MYSIIDKKELAPTIKMFRVSAPLVAKKSKPGQFIVVRIDEKGERIPLTIVDKDDKIGSITIIFQEVGKTTKQLGKLRNGDFILDLVGPLGKPSMIERRGTVVIIGGGIGVGEAYPEARAYKKAGNKVISIIGARSEQFLILEEEMAKVSDEIYISTDDGSKGHHGFVTDILRELINKKIKIDLIFSVGPVIMMKAISDITKPLGIKTLVSLNPIMVDATGMCGGCRVNISGESRFACVDGPTFDGHQVDFDSLMKRLNTFIDKEEISCKKFKKN